jgi:hypothetical protein
VGVSLKSNTFYLRVRIAKTGVCNFSYSVDGKSFSNIGESFNAR